MKKRLSLLLVALLSLSMVACSSKDATTEESTSTQAVESTEETTEETAAAEEEAAFPVTVTDQVGREVTIEEEPQKLVSGYYISTSLLIALGQEDKLVGIEAKADSRPIYGLAAPELLELPSVGTAKEFDLEGCAALEPDLIILPAKLQDTIPSLEELGFTVLAVNPEDQALLDEAITLLGDATGATEEAQALLDWNETALSDLATKLEGAKTPSVLLTSNSAFLAAAGGEMYQNSLIQQAGGTNVASELTGNDWGEISYEQVLAWNPDVIVLAGEADYTVDDVLSDSNLAGVTAVENGAVYAMPGDYEAWDSPVPSGVLGTLYLASVLHPDLYSTADFDAALTSFYETFYGFTPEA